MRTIELLRLAAMVSLGFAALLIALGILCFTTQRPHWYTIAFGALAAANLVIALICLYRARRAERRIMDRINE